VIVPQRQQPFQVNPVYQQRAVVDLRPYTRNRQGGMSRGLKWFITLFIFLILVITLAPVLIGLFGVLMSVLVTILSS